MPQPLVVVVCGDAGGAAAVVPVVEVLRAEGEVPIRSLAYRQACDLWAQRGLLFETLDECLSLDDVSETLRRSAASLLLTGTSVNQVMLENRFLKAAREISIPSVAVLDFWSNYTERFSDQEGRLTCVPDRIAVMDEQARSDMIAEGFDPSRLIVTGQPAFDDLIQTRMQFTGAQKCDVRAQLGISDNELFILFASQPLSALYGTDTANPLYPGFSEQAVLSSLVEALERIADESGRAIALVVRPHPREDREWLTSVQSARIRIVISSEGGSRNVVMAADLVSGMNSVLLLEACYLGCVTVSLQPGLRVADTLPTNRLGLSHGAHRTSEIKPVIEQLLLDTETRAAALERLQTFKPTSDAAQRVAQLVHLMLKGWERG